MLLLLFNQHVESSQRTRALADRLLFSEKHQMFHVRDWLSELWEYRELLWFLAWRDIKVRYKQTTLGAGWAILQPLLATVAFTVIFGRLKLAQDTGVPYPLFTYCALVPWTYFSAALIQGGNSLVANSELITKVYFPRVLLPASSALSGLLDFVVGSAFLGVLMAYYRVAPGWTIVFYPLLAGGLWAFTLAVSMALAALNVRYRDVKHSIPFLVQLGLFLTPVIYPVHLLPGRMQSLLLLNPVAGLVEAFRACLFPQHTVDVRTIAASAFVGTLVLILSAAYFRRTERVFADVV